MSRPQRNPRQGTLLICVLVCLLVASALATATTQSALRSRREVQAEHQMRQTELLLDAGILRAARQLQRTDDYQGESWRPAGAIARFDHAIVDIRVTAGEDSTHRVEVIASLGVAIHDARKLNASLTRRTHTFSTEPAERTPDSPASDSQKSAE